MLYRKVIVELLNGDIVESDFYEDVICKKGGIHTIMAHCEEMIGLFEKERTAQDCKEIEKILNDLGLTEDDLKEWDTEWYSENEYYDYPE